MRLRRIQVVLGLPTPSRPSTADGTSDADGHPTETSEIFRNYERRARGFRLLRSTATVLVMALWLEPLAWQTGDVLIAAAPFAAVLWYAFKRLAYWSGSLSRWSERLRAVSSVIELAALGILLLYAAWAYQESTLAAVLLLAWPVYRMPRRLPSVPLWLLVACASVFIALVELVASHWSVASASESLLAIIWFAVLVVSFGYVELDTETEEQILLRLEDETPLDAGAKLQALAATAMSSGDADVAILRLGSRPTPSSRHAIAKAERVSDEVLAALQAAGGDATASARAAGLYRAEARAFHRAFGARCFYEKVRPTRGPGDSPLRSEGYTAVSMILASSAAPAQVEGVVHLFWVGETKFSVERSEALDLLAQVLATDLSRWRDERDRQVAERSSTVIDLHDTSSGLNTAARLVNKAIRMSGDSELAASGATECLIHAIDLIQIATASLELLDTDDELPRIAPSDIRPYLMKRKQFLEETAESAPPLITFVGWDDMAGVYDPAGVASKLYLMTAEAMTNAVRHSGASGVVVTWTVTPPDMLSISVADDGHGIPGDAALAGGGMEAMKRRAESCGGECVVQSDSNGTTVIFSVPAETEWR